MQSELMLVRVSLGLHRYCINGHFVTYSSHYFNGFRCNVYLLLNHTCFRGFKGLALTYTQLYGEKPEPERERESERDGGEHAFTVMR